MTEALTVLFLAAPPVGIAALVRAGSAAGRMRRWLLALGAACVALPVLSLAVPLAGVVVVWLVCGRGCEARIDGWVAPFVWFATRMSAVCAVAAAVAVIASLRRKGSGTEAG